ncbi:MAG: ATP-dependent protease, partial [Firmicutes bacterium]|nr:ATP-dependent protease [Bacillota bacterium]
LLFPHIKSMEDVKKEEFKDFCLEPALEMRSIIKHQLHIMDGEYSDDVPNITFR